jgi:hypothetical protein
MRARGQLDVEQKPFTSSLRVISVQKPALERGGGEGGVTPPPSPPPYFPADLWIYHFKDDLTVILLGVSFMVAVKFLVPDRGI